jgi:hypothetical protein
MTLADWTALTGVLPTHPTTEHGAVSVVVATQAPHFHDLWKLADFKVVTRFQRGDTSLVWLLPRRSVSAS